MSPLPGGSHQLTEAEYLAFERESELKHEYIDGEIYAMTGASGHHNLIVASVIGGLIAQR
jgi:Uma2 family endonuclease